MNYERYISLNFIAQLLDKGKLLNRFTVRSMSSNKYYEIAFDSSAKAGFWICSCPNYLYRGGQCKHLDRENLPGRACGRQDDWLERFVGTSTRLPRRRWTKREIAEATAGFAE